MSLIRRRKLTKRQTRQIEQNQTVQADDATFAEGVICRTLVSSLMFR